MAETIYTVQEVADYLKVSKMFVYAEIHSGALAYIAVGTRNMRITQTGLDNYLRDRKTIGRAKAI